MLVKAGRTDEGLALLDEAMVGVTTERLYPVVAGLVYCGVILACQEAHEVRRARDWTAALSRWCEKQPDMVAFTGRCLVHRAEVLQLDGSWHDALAEVGRAIARFVETGNVSAAGLASYRQAELLRLLGRFDEAEVAYTDASRYGWEPQPGLAQLRLAQGKREAAAAAVRRALTETTDPGRLATLLPACVEIMLAVESLDEAESAGGALEELAARFDSALLRAMAAYASGLLALARGDPKAALLAGRDACRGWRDLGVPYEVARARVLVSEACRALEDAEAADLELDAARASLARLGAKPDVTRLDASRRADDQEHGLSPRELEVLRLLASGKSNRAIAAELVISEHTVARHVQNIFAKLRVPSRSAATAYAFEHELV
jgi:DNA-binding CsgD family transcriptional regulator